MIEEGYKQGGKIRGITTGYKPLDNATNGFIKGDLFIIAARQARGNINASDFGSIIEEANSIAENNNIYLIASIANTPIFYQSGG